VWSAGVNPQTSTDFEKRAAALLDQPDQANKQIKLFSISCGEKDALAFNGSKNFAEILKKRGVKHDLNISGGGHTWINWRQYLNDFAPRLFQTTGK
jgi:S-formylglutathione hydrolase FrmB